MLQVPSTKTHAPSAASMSSPKANKLDSVSESTEFDSDLFYLDHDMYRLQRHPTRSLGDRSRKVHLYISRMISILSNTTRLSMLPKLVRSNPFFLKFYIFLPFPIATLWPYSGKRYMQLFPTPQYQPAQHSGHMAPPVPPPMPPPSHEEDSAAQAAATRGYVYAYPPYGYPAQVCYQIICFFLSIFGHSYCLFFCST